MNKDLVVWTFLKMDMRRYISIDESIAILIFLKRRINIQQAKDDFTSLFIFWNVNISKDSPIYVYRHISDFCLRKKACCLLSISHRYFLVFTTEIVHSHINILNYLTRGAATFIENFISKYVFVDLHHGSVTIHR